MTNNDDTPATPTLEMPQGAMIGFPLLAAFAFVCMTVSMLAYARYGDALTDGLDRACAEAQFEAGKKHEALGNNTQALRYFRQAMDGRFSNPETRILCGRSIADMLSREGRLAEAIVAYEALPPESYDSAGAYTGYVEALRRDGRLEVAAEQGERWLALAEQENNTEQLGWSRNALMRIADARGDSETALTLARAIVAEQPGSDARLLMARILARTGRVAEAREEVAGFLEATQNTKLFAEARKLQDSLQ